MTLPMNLTLVRHGQSEANLVQKFVKTGKGASLPDHIEDMSRLFSSHDSIRRLSKEGVRQAEIAGEWLRNLDLNTDTHNFDRFYVSPHVRTRETAAHLKLNGEWIVDDRLRERDWGEVSNPSEDFTSGISELSQKIREQNPWYWKPQGGESLATGVRIRVESILESLHRRGDHVNSALLVAHGEFISVARFVIEKMTPDQFIRDDVDPNRKIDNTMIIQYSRQNPNSVNDIRKRYHWRRAVCPWDTERSWNNGEWIEFEPAKFSDSELLNFAESHDRLFSEEFNIEIDAVDKL